VKLWREIGRFAMRFVYKRNEMRSDLSDLINRSHDTFDAAKVRRYAQQMRNVERWRSRLEQFSSNYQHPKACPASLCPSSCSLVPRVNTSCRDG